MNLTSALNQLFFILCIATLGLDSVGCAARLKKAAVGSFIEDVAAATAKYDDVDLVAQAGPTYLLLLEALLESNPRDPQLLMSAAELYTSYGVLVETEDLDRARRLYHRAMGYGQRALSQKSEVGSLLQAPYVEFTQISEALNSEDVALVFWAASSWGAWISVSTESMAAIADLPKVIFLMEWILERDETFLYGSPHVFLGMYHSALPEAFGGNPEKARAHFERALEISERQSLIIYVQMARFYARQIFDRELYVELLETVLNRQPSVPELTLQNATAKKLAAQLLKEMDAYF